MTLQRRLGLPIAMLLAACLAQPDTNYADIIAVDAFDNATVQPAGPRGGASGKNFFNIEGNDNGAFASFGVVDFQLPTPVGPYTSVSQITVSLTQSNAGFTTDGLLNFYISEATSVGIQAGDAIHFDDTELPDGIGTQLDTLHFLGQASFVEVASGQLDEYTFALGGSVADYVLAQLNAGGVLRVAIGPADGPVAATYAGFSNSTWDGPRVSITAAAIPEPTSALVLMISSGLGATLTRRR